MTWFHSGRTEAHGKCQLFELRPWSFVAKSRMAQRNFRNRRQAVRRREAGACALHLLGKCLQAAVAVHKIMLRSLPLTFSLKLGEGGFSYVYLVKETASQRLFACKKASCHAAYSTHDRRAFFLTVVTSP